MAKLQVPLRTPLAEGVSRGQSALDVHDGNSWWDEASLYQSPWNFDIEFVHERKKRKRNEDSGKYLRTNSLFLVWRNDDVCCDEESSIFLENKTSILTQKLKLRSLRKTTGDGRMLEESNAQWNNSKNQSINQSFTRYYATPIKQLYHLTHLPLRSVTRLSWNLTTNLRRDNIICRVPNSCRGIVSEYARIRQDHSLDFAGHCAFHILRQLITLFINDNIPGKWKDKNHFYTKDKKRQGKGSECHKRPRSDRTGPHTQWCRR